MDMQIIHTITSKRGGRGVVLEVNAPGFGLPPTYIASGDQEALLKKDTGSILAALRYDRDTRKAFAAALDSWGKGGRIFVNDEPMPKNEVDQFMNGHLREQETIRLRAAESKAIASMGNLVGATVRGLYVGEGEGILAFDTDRGVIAFRADEDSGTSQSWFADINGVDALLGQVVTGTEAVEMAADVDDGRSRDDSNRLYGIKLTTALGHVDVVFRNSSNGYYGGYLSIEAEAPDFGTMRPILDDWQAGKTPAAAPSR